MDLAFWVFIGIMGTIGLLLFVRLIAGIAGSIWDAVSTRIFAWQREQLEQERIRDQNYHGKTARIYPDANARNPLLVDTMGTIRDPNNMRLYDHQRTWDLSPELERIDAMSRLGIAWRGHHSSTKQILGSTEETAREIELESSTLDHLYHKYGFRPRLHNILIGEYVDETEIKPLTLDLPKAVHVVCQGSSGMGKSTLSESVVLQLAQVPNVSLCAIDIGSGTFDALEQHLAYPICDTPQLAIALFREMIAICHERQTLFKQQQRIRTLDQYNSITGASLPYYFLFVDETASLLEHPQIKEDLTTLSMMGRKHGLGLWLSSTSLKVTHLPSEARGNAQCRISFWCESGLSRSMFDSNIASELSGVGDVVLMRPGVAGLTKGKTPLVTPASYATLPEPTIEQRTLEPIEVQAADVDSISDLDDQTQSKEQRVRNLKEQGYSDTAIARQVFNYGTAFYIKKVRGILAE